MQSGITYSKISSFFVKKTESERKTRFIERRCRLLRLYSVDSRGMKYEYVAMVEKLKYLEKTVLMPLCMPQIPYRPGIEPSSQP